jgi:hypothetical protein
VTTGSGKELVDTTLGLLSPPPVARSSDTRPPPPSVLLALHLPPAVAAMAAEVVAVVAAAAVAVRLPPAATKARATLLGPRSTTLGLTPSTCGRARLWVLLRPVLRSTSLPSLLHHSTTLRRSRRGPHIHLPWHRSHCLELRLHSRLHGLRGLQSGTCSPSLAPLARWSSPTPTPPPTGWQTPAPPVTPHPTLVPFTLLTLPLLLTLPPSLLVMAPFCLSPQ